MSAWDDFYKLNTPSVLFPEYVKTRSVWLRWFAVTTYSSTQMGGGSAAVRYNLSGSCKLNGIKPEAWLRHVICVINDRKVSVMAAHTLPHAFSCFNVLTKQPDFMSGQDQITRFIEGQHIHAIAD